MAKKKKEKPVDDVKEARIEGSTLPDQAILAEQKKEEDILSDVVHKFELADQWFDANKRSDFDYCEAAVISHLDNESNWTTISTIFDPATEKAVRALQAKTLVTIFQNGRDFFDIKGIGPSDTENAKVLKSLMKTVFDNMPNFVSNIATWNRQRLMYGTAVGKMVWDVRTTNTKGREYVDGKYSIVEKKVDTYKGPMFLPLDMKEEFRIDPSATGIDGFYKFHRTWKPYYALKASADSMGYKNVDKISKSATYQYTGTQRYVHLENKPPQDEDLVEVIEYWTADDSRRIVVANRSAIIKDEPNPYFHGKHPFIYSVYEKVDFKFYGRGIPMKVKPQQEWLNFMINLHNESALRYVCGQYQVPEDFIGDKIKFVPGGTVKSDSPIVPLQPSITPTDSLVLIAQLRNEIEETSGANRMSTSMGNPNVQASAPATVYAGTRNVLNEGHMADTILLEDMGLIEIVRMAYKLVLQCMDDPMWIQITEASNPIQVRPEQIALDADFVPKLGRQMMSKTEVADKLTMLLQTVGPVAQQVGVPLQDWFKALAKALGLDQEISFEEPQAEVPTAPLAQPSQMLTQLRPQMGGM